MIEFLLYMVDFLNNLNMIVLLVFVGMITLTLITITQTVDNGDEEFSKELKYFYKLSAMTLSICSVLFIIIPSNKTMYMMIGAHYLKNSYVPNKVESLLNKKLDEYLVEDSKK